MIGQATEADPLNKVFIKYPPLKLSEYLEKPRFGLGDAFSSAVITSEIEGTLYAVTQLEHSALVGMIAANWGGGAVALPLPRRPMLVMAAEHDLCWVYHDHRPRVDPETGAPYDYTTLPYAEHVNLYREGARYLAEREPYGALMLSLHGTGIYNGRHGTDAAMVRPHRSEDEACAVRTYLSDGERFRDSLKIQIQSHGDAEDMRGLDENTLWTNYHLMQVWDRLGLLFCKGIAEDFVIEPLPLAEEGAMGRIEFHYQQEGLFFATPYPFSTPELSVSVRARQLPQNMFRDDADYQAALDVAPHTVFNFRIRAS